MIAFLSALDRHRHRHSAACMAIEQHETDAGAPSVMGIANIPMLNADIVTGISLMLVFLVIGNFLSHFGPGAALRLLDRADRPYYL